MKIILTIITCIMTCLKFPFSPLFLSLSNLTDLADNAMTKFHLTPAFTLEYRPQIYFQQSSL